MSDSQELIGDRYRLLEHIGQGGMGTVWRARDEVLGRQVAVKEVIPSPDLTGPEREVFTVRTLREARAAGRIGHPGVATVYDVIEERGRPWIVMQLVDSRTLGAVIREDGPLPPVQVARIGLDVLGALVAAHRVGVLHRDVKPDNVLLATDGRAVLTDFGIAVLEGDSSVTRTGALIGTPAFIAPERAMGGPAQFASDLWSLGVTLYMVVEGHSPFQRAHPLATLSAVMHEAPGPLRLAGPLGPVIHGLLRKDPAHRMSTQEVQTHLAAIVAGTAPEPTMPVDVAAPPPAAVAGAPLPPRDTAPAAAAAAVVAPALADGGTPPGVPAPGPLAAASGPDPWSASGGPGSRRRSMLTAATAAALAIALSAGGMAWITSKSSGTDPAKPPTSVSSVPATEDEAPGEPESTELTGGTDPEPADTRPSASPTRDDRGENAPTGKPSDKPSQKPKPSQEDPGGSDGSSDAPEDDSGGSEQESDPGSGDDSPGQVNPGSGVNALSPGAAKGKKAKPAKAVKALTKGKGKGKGKG
ncbi:serine/threonine-protein kinase [Planobispora takensis]|uniref:non-specific serine/threonine protein kinase n=1 Tax=Planobispora takensis TaxID=1367882 RepID=A0A8J3T111_9ACTN|nr:serine/threonine-protein kinase [Planobispora takensis]GII02446.1 hypothetical protein Pta02_44540 [Planobispora takensis]